MPRTDGLLGRRRARVVRRRVLRGAYCLRRGWYAEGERWARRAEEVARRVDPAAHPALMVELASLWHGLHRHRPARECVLRAAGPLSAAPPGPGRDGPLADALVLLGDVERRLARYDRAEAYLRRAEEPARAAGGTGRRRLVAVRLALGVLCKETGRYGEAEVLYREALTLLERYGGDPLARADALHNLAGLAHARRDDDGERHIRAAIGIRRAVLGPRHVQVAADLTVLGALLTERGDLDEAEDALRRAEGILREHLGGDHYEVAVCQVNLARLDALRGRAGEAARRRRDALRVKRLALGPDHPEVLRLAASVRG
ncbi:tetratricopeptide repeat protein [Streptosporangium sp. NPDC048047]|uniref:tetratricopeptide repeat protein n=1 Tax=Streptosporangium sp. NPDC048047 TaxID=3155748 RepID=UPI0034362E83